MMKKFFYLSAILAIVLVSCNSEKEYIAKLSNTASMIEKEADLSEAITLHYCDTWRKVIYDHEYNGEYCTDFNDLRYLLSDSDVPSNVENVYTLSQWSHQSHFYQIL